MDIIPNWIEDGVKWTALAEGVLYARRHPKQTKAVARTVVASGVVIALAASSFSELATSDCSDNVASAKMELNPWNVSGPTTSVDPSLGEGGIQIL